MSSSLHALRRRVRLRDEDGFTMLLAIGVMFVTGLLLVAAFTVANGEVSETRTNTFQRQAYYAALAGIQQYEAKLQAEPSYWQTCEAPSANLPEEENQSYAVTVLVASTAPSGTEKCSTSSPFESVIESKGTLMNTFRIKSIGTVGTGKSKATRSLIATFKVSGFLDYVYYTNFETEDPGLYEAPSGCAAKYRSEWSAKGLSCATITFTNSDDVKGPMHSNDAAKVEGTVAFGREGQSPADSVEINGGTYPEAENECKSGSGEAKFYTSTKCYTAKGPTILPPEGDTSLAQYVESENHFTGETRLALNGTSNTIEVTKVTANAVTKKIETSTSTINWPKNGLIYVDGSCAETTRSYAIDNETEMYEKVSCGTVYVNGTYSKPLTVAGTNDVVVNGNIVPTGVTAGNAPTGTATMGLIAGEFVRIYHPVKSGSTNTLNSCSAENLSSSEDPLKWGAMTNPWIYAAILSTNHSFFVDNFKCGKQLEELNVYGAIAQDYRGIVGQVGSSGYIKDYKYDSRLATDEPPYFLAPLKAGWKISRLTAPSPG